MSKITISPFFITLNENEKKIHFNSKIKIDNCNVKIYELSSNLIIYSNFFNFDIGINYWIQIGPTFNLLNGLKVSISVAAIQDSIGYKALKKQLMQGGEPQFLFFAGYSADSHKPTPRYLLEDKMIVNTK